jgi:hypothetical protein
MEHLEARYRERLVVDFPNLPDLLEDLPHSLDRPNRPNPQERRFPEAH